ncbi:chascon [Anaeramoeba flamelloides]|uniref:Chascon n=1 Tax=Anaeramoeba flamelloides TaxID=1746091 RepID=A0ABQ8YSP3_9EUKA|nr:chascon [Anaeramoeba flamelloides]
MNKTQTNLNENPNRFQNHQTGTTSSQVPNFLTKQIQLGKNEKDSTTQKQIEKKNETIIKIQPEKETKHKNNTTQGIKIEDKTEKEMKIENEIEVVVQMREEVENNPQKKDQPKEKEKEEEKEKEKEKEKEEEEYDPSDNVIRCPCGNNVDNYKLMIQCEKCRVWQHAVCVAIKNPPKHYFCELCEPRIIDCICGKNNDHSQRVVKCKICQKCYHSKCVNTGLRGPKKKNWVCGNCKEKNTNPKSRRRQKTRTNNQRNVNTNKNVDQSQKKHLDFGDLGRGSRKRSHDLKKENEQLISEKKKSRRKNNNQRQNQEEKIRNEHYVLKLDFANNEIKQDNNNNNNNNNNNQNINNIHNKINYNKQSTKTNPLEFQKKQKKGKNGEQSKIGNNINKNNVQKGNFNNKTKNNDNNKRKEYNNTNSGMVINDDGINKSTKILKRENLIYKSNAKVSSNFGSLTENLKNGINDIISNTKIEKKIERAKNKNEKRSTIKKNENSKQKSIRIKEANIMRMKKEELLKKIWKRTGAFDRLFFTGHPMPFPIKPSKYEVDRCLLMELFVNCKQRKKTIKLEIEKKWFETKNQKIQKISPKYENFLLKKIWIKAFIKSQEEKKRRGDEEKEREKLKKLRKLEEEKLAAQREKENAQKLKEEEKKRNLKKKKFSLREYKKKRATISSPKLSTLSTIIKANKISSINTKVSSSSSHLLKSSQSKIKSPKHASLTHSTSLPSIHLSISSSLSSSPSSSPQSSSSSLSIPNSNPKGNLNTNLKSTLRKETSIDLINKKNRLAEKQGNNGFQLNSPINRKELNFSTKSQRSPSKNNALVFKTEKKSNNKNKKIKMEKERNGERGGRDRDRGRERDRERGGGRERESGRGRGMDTRKERNREREREKSRKIKETGRQILLEFENENGKEHFIKTNTDPYFSKSNLIENQNTIKKSNEKDLKRYKSTSFSRNSKKQTNNGDSSLHDNRHNNLPRSTSQPLFHKYDKTAKKSPSSFIPSSSSTLKKNSFFSNEERSKLSSQHIRDINPQSPPRVEFDRLMTPQLNPQQINGKNVIKKSFTPQITRPYFSRNNRMDPESIHFSKSSFENSHNSPEKFSRSSSNYNSNPNSNFNLNSTSPLNYRQYSSKFDGSNEKYFLKALKRNSSLPFPKESPSLSPTSKSILASTSNSQSFAESSLSSTSTSSSRQMFKRLPSNSQMDFDNRRDLIRNSDRSWLSERRRNAPQLPRSSSMGNYRMRNSSLPPQNSPHPFP